MSLNKFKVQRLIERVLITDLRKFFITYKELSRDNSGVNKETYIVDFGFGKLAITHASTSDLYTLSIHDVLRSEAILIRKAMSDRLPEVYRHIKTAYQLQEEQAEDKLLDRFYEGIGKAWEKI